MEIPIILDNLLPKETNDKIILELCNHHWFIAFDLKENNRKDQILSSTHCGFNVSTFRNEKVEVDSILNFYGQIIFDIAKDKLKINAKLDRMLWNMYMKGDEGLIHTDHCDSNYKSLLYSIHTTDGGIEIDGIFYPDVTGQAKIFNSNIPHRGIGPKIDNARFNLNMVFKI